MDAISTERPICVVCGKPVYGPAKVLPDGGRECLKHSLPDCWKPTSLNAGERAKNAAAESLSRQYWPKA